jgi:hypothetical protein
MKQIIYFLQITFTISILISSKAAVSEPFVVLEYRNGNNQHSENSNNIFIKDANYNSKHKVLKDETLSDIMLSYYGSKLFNKTVLSLAIVHFNKHAFVRKNPNFLFSGKSLYLPSINEIKNLIINKPNNSKDIIDNQPRSSSQIYFFGG